MLLDCTSCQIKRSGRTKSVGSLKARTLMIHSPINRLINTGKLNVLLTHTIGISEFINVEANFVSNKESISIGLHGLLESADSYVDGHLSVSGNLTGRISSLTNLHNTYVDKFAGSIDKINKINNFQATEKLYPIKDIVTVLNGNYFVNKNLATQNLYNSIDEGVFTGNYTQPFKNSVRISDEVQSYIQPSSILTDGDFRYKFEVTTPTQVAKESFLFIRASAPTRNYISRVPPQYTISNIKLEDPSGNLIIKYKDIVLFGDSDYTISNINYTTYISEPEVNNLLLHTWDYNYPFMEEGSGYTLNLNINSKCLDDPFNAGFNVGYEDDCELSGIALSLPENRPTVPANSLRISAIEICNSGGVGILRDNYLNFYSEVPLIGQRIERSILPVEVLNNSFNTEIYPTVYSTWKSSNGSFYNSNSSGSTALNNILINDSTSDFITLDYIDGIADSGKLNLKFSHKSPTKVIEYTDGAFSFGEGRNFNSAALNSVAATDNFFIIDTVELKVRARKAIGSRDYSLDVVGYSDDGLLNITPAIGGFLQNISGVGILPQSSGFNNADELAISSETLSDKDEYYISSLTNNDGGDHYQLSTVPVVDSTAFADYIIPLKIYEDRVSIGKSKDYSMSSSFENLYIDIYPLPSGASIANIQLIVHYKPSNGLMLHTLGQASREIDSRTVKIYPSSRQINDDIINTGPEYSPISLIQNIPHAYKTPQTLKTNYSRRWRGVEGSVVAGPFDPYQFDFSFYNPQLQTPFLRGYYSFNNDYGNAIISDSITTITPISGTYIGSYNSIKNIGLRFNSVSAFSESTPYTTIDWTSIAGYENDSLYGLIADSYDNAIRVSGTNGYVDFGNIDTVSGFSIFARFSPDINMSGIGYNLWNSGMIFSKYDDGKNLEFSLGYENGYLTGYARASNGTLKKVQDSLSYDEYQYPLATMLTYNDNLSEKLKLYTDNEKSSIGPFNNLRDQSSTFTLTSSNSNLRFGYSDGHHVGINAFITDIGISTYNSSGTNIISSSGSVNLLYKQIFADKFFETLRHKFWNPSESYVDDTFKLWQYIDEDVSEWKLGAFKICAFSPDYDSFTKRIGSDYIIHRLKHDGSPYNETTDLTLPASVPTSGVSYHTQIENDFLRFNLINIPEANTNFVAVPPRICKTLPRGYDFAERAMAVDTIIEHDTVNNIIWNDGKIGPKLIVSLYTKNQNPVDRPSKINWGLINRHTHYLEPSGCWTKLSSIFDFNNLIDTSEPWSNFDQSRNTTELDTKYYSSDINDMFLQYDLSYPSGSPFDSVIKIHSANIRLENVLIQSADSNGQLNLTASGEYKALSSMDLYSRGLENTNDDLNMFVISDVVPTASSIMNLVCSGAVLSNNSLQLYSLNIGSVDSSDGNYFGAFDIFGSSPSFGSPLFVDGRFNQFGEQDITLFTKNLLSSQTSSGNLPLFLSNKLLSEFESNSLNMSISSNVDGENHSPTSKMSLYVQLPSFVPESANNFNLYVKAQDYTITVLEDTLNLFTINYLAYNQNLTQQTTIGWNKDNVGTGISVSDNQYATLNANDEIRGVDLLCYGNCGDETSCLEQSVLQHEQLWEAPIGCVDGGIFRAENTYTNLATSGFNTPVGYSGHFYGIRKYTDLIPSAPYKVIITGKTGNTNYISVPSEFEDLNYYIEGVGQSGVKLIGDQPFAVSGRQTNDTYGKSVAIKGDLIAVGSPFHSVADSENYILNDAGTVFLYRRLPAPSGNSWSLNISEHKSPWILEEQINLPSGYIRDYYINQSRNLLEGFSPITERYWNVGQEGRQFGHSLDLAISSGTNSLHENNKEILVVGGPSSKWTRTFDTVKPSSVPVGLIIFTDEFQPLIDSQTVGGYKLSYIDVLNSIRDKDLIFNYFSSPSTAFDVKLIILEPTLDSPKTSLNFPDPKPTFITKKRIHRRQGSNLQTELVLSGIKEAFHEAFPYNTSLIDNNIPPIIGFYVDNSASLGKASLNGPNGGGAIDQFISYYKGYSFASGVRDFSGVQSSGATIEFVPTFDDAENWVKMSQDVLNFTLDTGRLTQDNQIKYFTSDIGDQYFNPNLGEFNHIPSSGGKVYIFEKESGVWGLIQQIDSPITSYGIPDRFGHAVAISDNTEVVAIGSPYINNACEIYEYKESEKLRLYNSIGSWINFKSSESGGVGRYATLRSSYNDNSDNFGLLEAGKTLYVNLNTTEKFDVRRYLNITEYQNIKSFKYSDLSIVGTWEFLTYKFVPTPRLGYSVSVNDDGSIVAFGSPTDSLNQWDDGNVWYKNDGYYEPLDIDGINGEIISSWRSNTNAGSVRLFESRNYYPHNSVVEFTKFGNLQQSTSLPQDSLHYVYLSGIFQDNHFRKTDFEELNIPQEAGLAFIITPEIDAVSNEILDNIIRWLSLGDRNLVLVGNDPLWEDNGIYSKSNDIINKILAGLKSRMRLHPARNLYEALVSGCDLNIIPATIPTHATSSYIQPYAMRGYGVADIRMHFPNYSQLSPCVNKDNEGRVINTKCELPLMDNGDLRAQWYDLCYPCLSPNPVLYPVNWPLVFKNFTTPCCNPNSSPVPRYDLTNLEPVPLLAAAEFSQPITIIYPAVPEKYALFPVFKDVQYVTEYYDFDKNNMGSGIEFIWSASSGNYTYLNTNIGNTPSDGKFFNPDPFDDRDSVLQSKSISREELVTSRITVDIHSTYCAQENYQNSTSKVILIAGVDTESESELYYSAGDRNLNFYANVVYNTDLLNSNIAQLGGWTNRTNFSDGFSNSYLNALFLNLGHDVELNADRPYTYNNICWIANTETLPSTQELNDIKDWLLSGDKKLVITYNFSPNRARIASQLCSSLGLSISPLFLDGENKYAESRYLRLLTFNPSSDMVQGRGINIATYDSQFGLNFIPIKTINPNQSVCYANTIIQDIQTNLYGYWQMKSGVAKISFPVISGSGYRVFVNTVSETLTETESLKVYTCNANTSANSPYPSLPGIAPIRDLDYNNDTDYDLEPMNLGDVKELRYTTPGFVNTYFVDVQIPSGISELTMYFEANRARSNNQNKNYAPNSIRLLSVSGVSLPIKTLYDNFARSYIESFQNIKVSDAIPETTVIIPPSLQQISTDNSKYCSSSSCTDNNMDKKLIADGPVVAAQEVESITSFTAGHARSRITVLSDSSFVQGSCTLNEEGRIPENTINFIRSLYPVTEFSNTNNGRQFNTMTKIVGPERGSPQKYYAISGNSGINSLFNTTSPLQASLLSFDDKESKYSPAYVIRTPKPYTDDMEPREIERIKNEKINEFINSQRVYGATAKFSGIIEGKLYEDASFIGGMPELMKDTGYDYLDLHRFPSGYPGDLFGYSIDLYKNKLIVGSPFAGFSQETAKPWSYYVNGGSASGIKLGYNGGAGSVYMFEQTFKGSGLLGKATPWEFTHKLRPDSINIGSGNVGNSIIGDKFGYDISIDGDIIVIGAPGHDFGNYIIETVGSFGRKFFNKDFNYLTRTVRDLGSSNARNELNSHGSTVNHGAVFTFENRIIDWATKTKKWTYIEKSIPEYYNDNLIGNINDNYGESVHIDKSNRTDASYTMIVGSPFHQYATSGNHTSVQPLAGAGSAYITDIMLREQPASSPSPNSFINSRVFGETFTNSPPPIILNFKNNNDNNKIYSSSGIIYSNNKGEIFLEASGQDPAIKGFIQHRPYILAVDGQYVYGTEAFEGLRLSAFGKIDTPNNMNLYANVDDNSFVYNNIGMYTSSITDFASGTPSGLYLFTESPNPTEVSNSGLTLFASGIGSNVNTLNLNIRGK